MWHFLRLFELPYCSLYAEGYTSLGKSADTFPNPYLKKRHGGGEMGERFWPAWCLANFTKERSGRGRDRAESETEAEAAASAEARGEGGVHGLSDVDMSFLAQERAKRAAGLPLHPGAEIFMGAHQGVAVAVAKASDAGAVPGATFGSEAGAVDGAAIARRVCVLAGSGAGVRVGQLRTDFEGQRISCELVDDSFLTMEGDAPVVDAALESIMTCDPSQCRLLRLL